MQTIPAVKRVRRSPVSLKSIILILVFIIIGYIFCNGLLGPFSISAERIIFLNIKISGIETPEKYRSFRIEIYSNGCYKVCLMTGETSEGMLAESALKKLLKGFEHEGLYAISDLEINREIDALERYTHVGSGVIDAETTLFEISLPHRKIKFRRYALNYQCEKYPKAQKIRILSKCINNTKDAIGYIRPPKIDEKEEFHPRFF